MIGLNILLIIAALIIAFFLFFKLLKNTIKALIFVLFLALFVIAVLGFLVYLDIGKVKGSYEKGQTVLLLHDESIVAGFIYEENPNEILQSNKLELLDENTISSISDSFRKGSYAGEETLTIIMQSSYFIGKSVELAEGYNLILTKENINTLFSCNDVDKCITPLIDAAPSLKRQISSSFEDEQDLKNKLFFSAFNQESKNSKGAFILYAIKNNQMIVYPSLTTLKLVQMIPNSFIGKALAKIPSKNTQEDTTKTNNDTAD
ncbi:MAG: hypothetical protein ACP5N2_00140 [Candidatus Nanoarchaeia archaeon]